MRFQVSWLRACGVCVSLMFPAAALATNVDPGPISADSVWSLSNSPYVIQGDVTVTAKLSIEPGVRIEFAGPYVLSIAATGVLNAIGTTQNHIVFTVPSQVTAPVAAQLIFNGSAGVDVGDAVFNSAGAYQSGSILENVIVEKLGNVDTTGAVVLLSTYPYIHNSIFRNNGASAIYANSVNGDLRIENNTIESNSALLGAGLFITTKTGAMVILRENNLVNNSASLNGGGMYFSGTGEMIKLSGNIFRANNAGFQGGGLFTNKIAMEMAGEIVRDNTAASDNGGGLYLGESQATIIKSIFLRNHSKAMGGGIFLNVGNYSIRDSVLAMNESETAHGGGIDMHGYPTVTIDHSVVAGNKAEDYGAGVSITEGICTVTNSAIVLNESSNTIGISIGATISGNTIAYNSVKSTSELLGSTIGIKEDASQNLAIQDNNIFNNATPYDIVTFDNGTAGNEAIVNAQSNWWGDALIQNRLKIGDAIDLAAINADSPRTSMNTTAPVSPPRGVTAIPAAGTIKLQWQANPESDIQGYKVYWGSKPLPDFENVVDVGNVTSYEIPDALFVAVTAYDLDYALVNDNAATPVNEKQTQGHESWYSVPESTIAMVADPLKHQVKDDLVYLRITVTNTGPSVGDKDFVITHTILSGLSYYYYSNGEPGGLPSICKWQPSSPLQVICTHPKLDTNARDEIVIPVKVIASETSDAVSTVVVRPIDYDTNPAESQAQVILHVNAPDLDIRWSNAQEVNVKTDESVKYQVTAKNIGRVQALSSKLDVTIPAIFTIDALDPRCAPVVDASTRFSCDLGKLSGNGETSIALSLTATQSGEAVLLASAFTDGDSDAGNNQALLPATITSPVQGSGDADAGTDSPPSKKGGGVVDLVWLLMLLSMWVVRPRLARYSTV